MIKVVMNVGVSGFLAKYKYWHNKGDDNWELKESSDIILIESKA